MGFIENFPPHIVQKGKQVNLYLENGLYGIGFSKRLQSAVIGSNLWYPVRIRSFMNPTVTSYMCIPLSKLYDWIEDSASHSKTSPKIIDVYNFALKSIWKMHDSSIYKHKYLYSVHADYKLRRLELKTNKITVLDNEPVKASEIIAIDRHTIVCSSLTTFST